jgi:transcription factor SOX7/8/10/18 (SOX group E/F)
MYLLSVRLYPGLNNRTISQMLGAMWRSLPSEEKEPFQVEAAKEREHHKKQHPDWKYSIDRAKGVKRRMKVSFH